MIPFLALAAAWEGSWYLRRRALRKRMYELARLRANALGRPLVVVGAPDSHVTGNYGCGDVTIDIAPSSCPNARKLDITKPIPIASDSVVVFCSCVLEYVDDAPAALRELQRISGGNLFLVRVEPWTLTSVLYPGAKRSLPGALAGVPPMEPPSFLLRKLPPAPSAGVRNTRTVRLCTVETVASPSRSRPSSERIS